MAHHDNSSALTPVSPDARVFDASAHRSLWFSLGVGLLVMQVGAYLVPAVGTQDALLAIVLGSILGAGLLAWAAKLGCDSGLSSAGLMHRVFGSAFARLPVLLNIVQAEGMDVESAMEILRSDTYAEDVRAKEHFYTSAGIHSVPAVIINDKHLISGGQPAEVFTNALRQIAAGA